MSKPPGKKGLADIAALKAKLGVKAPAKKGPPAAAAPAPGPAEVAPQTPIGAPLSEVPETAAPKKRPATVPPPGAEPPTVLPPGAEPPTVLPPGAEPPTVLPPGARAPSAPRSRTAPPTVLPPGMAPPPEEEETGPVAPVRITGTIDRETAAAGGIGGGKVLQKVMATVVPAMFFALIGWSAGSNNSSRNVMNERVAAAEALYERMSITVNETLKVKKNFDRFFVAIKERGDADFTERMNFSKYLAGLRLETFVDDDSLNGLTAFMSEGLVTRLLSFYKNMSSFVALANHHGHVVAVHADDLLAANKAARGFRDLRYVVKVPRNEKTGAPMLDGVAPGALGIADFELVDPKAKNKEIKLWRFTPTITDDESAIEELPKFGVAVILPESKKGLLEPRNRSLLREFNIRLGSMHKIVKKLTEDGKKILTGPENTVEAEKSKGRVFAL